MTARELGELGGVTVSDAFPEPLAALPEAAVVARVLAGDREAFGVLVDRHHARCLRVATQLLGNADDADDVVQETFLRAFRHLGHYRERDKFAAWLLRIAVNQCRTRRARDARWVPLVDEAMTHAGSDAGILASTDDAIVQAEQRLEMTRALERLAPAERELLVLKYGEEMGYAELAALTGVSVSALKMRVNRACARLRALLLPQSTR